MKRRLVLLISIVMVVSLFGGCNGNKDSSSSKTETAATGVIQGTVRIGTAFDWSNKNPYSAMSPGSERCIRNIFEPLFDRDPDTGKMIPVIAKASTKVDSYTYDVTLYDYVKDSAGNKITADDVIYSFKTMKEQGNYWTAYLIASITKVDDYTIRLKAVSDREGVLETILCNTPIVSQASYAASSDKMTNDPIGSGAYVLNSYTSGSDIKFSLNKNYWQTKDARAKFSEANISNLDYKVITQPAQLSIAMETGQVDVMPDVPSSEMYHFAKGGDDSTKFKLNSFTSNFIWELNYNCYKGNSFSNQSLRQAVSYAIDKASILKAAINNYGTICYTLASQSLADYNKDWSNQNYYNFNVATAKKLLSEAGYSSGQLTIRLLSDNSTVSTRIDEVIQSDLSNIGIKVKILSYETALFNSYKTTTDQYDMFIDQFTCDDFITTEWDNILDQNKFKFGTYSNYSDTKLQQLLLAACSKSTKSSDTVEAARKYIAEVVPSLGLISPDVYHTTTKKVINVAVNVSDYIIPGAFTYASDFASNK